MPGTVFRSDTALFAPLPWRPHGVPLRVALSGGVTYVGRRPLPYGQVSDQILTVDASAVLSWSRYDLRLVSTNLLNTQYRLGEFNFASDLHSQPQPSLVPERAFAAGAPRGVFVTFGVNIGGS